MESRKAGTDPERESGVIDNRQTKRPRVEDEDALDNEDESTPRVVPQASDLYLDTVRGGRFVTSTHVISGFPDQPRQLGF